MCVACSKQRQAPGWGHWEKVPRLNIRPGHVALLTPVQLRVCACVLRDHFFWVQCYAALAGNML